MLHALVPLVIGLAIIATLLDESWAFFQRVTAREFFFGSSWAPFASPPSFGIAPLLLGTAQVVIGAGVVALPLGLAAALYLSEFASARVRAWAKPALAVLSGMPTVVIGFLVLRLLTPTLQGLAWSLGLELQLFNALSASLAVAILSLPTLTTLCDDALRAVPRSLREAGLALGATSLETIRGVVIPAALPKLAAAFVLSLARAIGETMAVTLTAGQRPSGHLDFFAETQTLTSFLVQAAGGSSPKTLATQSLFAVALLIAIGTVTAGFLARGLREQGGRS